MNIQEFSKPLIMTGQDRRQTVATAAIAISESGTHGLRICLSRFVWWCPHSPHLSMQATCFSYSYPLCPLFIHVMKVFRLFSGPLPQQTHYLCLYQMGFLSLYYRSCEHAFYSMPGFFKISSQPIL